MEFLDLAKKRCSVRSYEDSAVEKDKLDKILEAARIAPTAANRQPVRIMVIDEADRMERLKRAANVYDAPLALVVCSDRERAWRRPADDKSTSDIDAAIVTVHMMMEAASLGLGSVWICWFDPTLLAEELKLPASLEPVNILAVGYANEPAKPTNRYSTERLALKDILISS